MARIEMAIVIVTYNSARVIENLLDSIPAALGDVRAEVVVVDNGSTDTTVEIVEAYGGCHLVRADNLGYAAGLNTGASTVPNSETILILNPDLHMSPGSIPVMLDALRSTGAGIVAPRVLEPDGSLFRSLRREPTLRRASGLGFTKRPVVDEYVSDLAVYEVPGEVDWALGAALLLSRDCYRRLGGWDESFFLYSEETDYCLRAADLGWRTHYSPDAVVTHIGGDSGQSPRIYAMQILNRVRLYVRRHSPLAGWSYFSLAVLRELSGIIRGRVESRMALETLLVPRRRPVELDCSGTLLPR